MKTFHNLPATDTPINSNNLNGLQVDILTALGLNQDTYDPSHTYAVGNKVIHGGAIWECNTANTTGAWDSTKWTLVPFIDAANL